ncbi:hypothetical protein ACOMHN_050135 [Nucella lapillus]
MIASKVNMWRIFLWVLCGLWHCAESKRILVDMAGQGCFDLKESELKDEDVYSVYARFDPNRQPTLDHCDVGIRAVGKNRRLEYLVDKLTIFDCGISIWLYDNPQLVSSPTRKITCSDDRKIPLQGKTSHGVIRISLRKESTQATALEFQIHVKTDYGPPFDFEKDDKSFYELPLDTGAIVGIVIAGSVVIIAVAGLAIYCCLKARMTNRRKHAEASDGQSSPPSIYTTGTSRVVYQPSGGKQRSDQNGGGGGFSRPASQDSSEKLPSKHKTNIHPNDAHAPEKNKSLNSHHTPYKDPPIHTNKDNNIYTNRVYENEEKLERQASHRGSQKRCQPNTPRDDADHAKVKGGHLSRRDSSRSRVKYDKKTKYSRHDDYGSVGKGKKNGHRARSRSPNSQGSIGSTVDSNALVYGYSRTSAAHPNNAEDTTHRHRSRSRSRAGSQRSGSLTRSRTGSVGRSEGRGRSESRGRSEPRDGRRTAPKNVRQYGDMSDFLPPEQQDQQRHRSRSGSVGRSHRR